MPRRLVALALLATVLATVLAAPAAGAKPAQVCRIVTDERGDTRAFVFVPSSPATAEPALDIVSADVATDARHVTVAVRVAELTLPDERLPRGARYSVYFKVGPDEADWFVLHARAAHGGRQSALYRLTPLPTVVTPVVLVSGWEEHYVDTETKATYDFARDEVRVSAPVGAFAPFVAIKRGMRIKEINAITWHDQTLYVDPVLTSGHDGERDASDVATAPKPYVAGTPSCLRPGS